MKKEKTWFDLDGVLRNLSGNFLSQSPEVWHWYKRGKDIYHFVNDDLECLAKSKPTKFCPLVATLPHINILTCQPKDWRQYTLEWIQNNIGDNVTVTFVEQAKEKLDILAAENGVIFEDYPMFEDYSRVYLVDYPYNRGVTGYIEKIKTVNDMRLVLTEGGLL
jgi:FMN phosphatase YigB (HAD superfamily)